MKFVLWLILFVIVLIFAPGLLVWLFQFGVVGITEIVSDPFWKYMLYVLLGIFAAGFIGYIVNYNSSDARKKREAHARQVEKIKAAVAEGSKDK